MRSKTLKKPRVNVITLGCSKNLVDSEVLMGHLKAASFEVSHEADGNESPVVVINTCGFIDKAKQESIDTILRYAEARKEGALDKLYVTGCLSERYKDDLKSEIPEVDAWFGTRDLPRLLKTLKADYKAELVGERLLTTPAHFAYLKISEGCDRPCSFCAIPLMRGKHVSVPPDILVSQARSLAAKGTRELLLIAQDSTYYGLDLHGKRTLADLLYRLSEVDGIDWIRLHYAFPAGFPEEVLDVIRDNHKLCKYIDMPLQHISDPVLKSMRRGTTRQKTDRLVNLIREKVPGISIRTTLISGYPGETVQYHEEMMQWLRDMRFERVGVFTYSHEENTHAGSLQDDVAEEEKHRRAGELMSVQQQISREMNEAKEGKLLKVLFDRSEGDFYVGRTEADSPEVDHEVLVSSKDLLIKPGQFGMVRITGAEDYDLFGTLEGSLF
jgi:ribosomal protein S12 methylthiotransferase